jgi:hypothetical protein
MPNGLGVALLTLGHSPRCFYPLHHGLDPYFYL